MRFSIFSGTHSFREIPMALGWLFSPKIRWQKFQQRERYEKMFAEKIGGAHAASFGAGRMALYALLQAFDFKAGDEIILPAYTCVVVPNALIYLKLKPVYADISLKDFNIDVDQIESLVTQKTKAIYAQHTFGVPCDMDRIREIADRHGLLVIEDAAHSLGSKYKGKWTGSLGDGAFFSTDHSKTIDTVVGGVAIVKDHAVFKKLKKFQAEAEVVSIFNGRKIAFTFLAELLLFTPSFLSVGRYFYSALHRMGLIFSHRDEGCLEKPKNYPTGMTEFQAALGFSQLKNLDKNLGHRLEIAASAQSKIGYYKFAQEEFNQFSWLRYSWLVKDRDALLRKFKAHWDFGTWFVSIFHGRNEGFELLGYKRGSCPRAEFAAAHIFNLPTHQRIDLREVDKLLNKMEISREEVLSNGMA